jgi:Cu/Ag efflux pump CusA
VKSPELVVTVCMLMFVAVLVAATRASGTAAPELSVMVPVMMPRSVWAASTDANTTTGKKQQRAIATIPSHME